MIQDTENAVLTTLVIPNYNHARFLDECIGAILSQTSATAKVVFIDDASSDRSLDVAHSLLAGRANISIIEHQVNQGVVSCLNEGLTLADTPFVAFAAADDRLLPQFLEISQNALQQFPDAALAVAESDIIDAAGRYRGHRPAFPPAFRNGYISPAKVRRLLSETDNFLIGNVALYRTKLLKEIGGFDRSVGYLCDGIVMRLLAVRYGFYFIRQTLGCWRQHGQNNSTAAINAPSMMETTIAEMHRFVEQYDNTASFPRNYGDLLERRMRFGAMRLRLEKLDYSFSPSEDIRTFSASNDDPCNFTSLRLIARLPIRSLRAFFTNFYLYLIYRPYKISAILRIGRDRLVRARSALFNPGRHSVS